MRGPGIGVSAIALAAVIATPAWAQSGGAGGGSGGTQTTGAAAATAPETQAETTPNANGQRGQEGEIIVTGLKRSEKFINAPVAVQVFSEKTIAQAGITRPQDFLLQTPNVTFIQSNHAGEAFVNVRGQSSVRQSESAVAVVIDGVQLATQNEFNGELFDIQQIEVLKGPQSAIYGRNATAGAIIITTKPPSDDLEGFASLSYGSYNTSKAVASASGALVPGKLRIRLSGAYTNTDGPYRNIITGEHSYRSNEYLGRLRLDWQATDRLKFDFRLSGSRLGGGAIAANAEGPGIKNAGRPSPVDGNDVSQPFVTDVPGKNLQGKVSSSLKGDYDLGFGTLTSVSSYSKIVDRYEAKLFPYQAANDPRNDAGNAILFGDQTQKYRIANEAFNEEVRFTSSGKGPLRYQLGLYYLESTRDFTTIQGFNGRVPLNADGTPNAGIGGYLPDPNGEVFASLDPGISSFLFGAPFNRFHRLLIGGGAIAPNDGISGLDTNNPTNGYDITRFRARNIAPFANAQWDITKRLELGVAVRYDNERRSVRTLTPDVTNPFTGKSFSQCVSILGIPPSQCERHKTFDQVQPKVTLTYKLPDIGSAYLTYGKGFKSGGFNPIGTREIVVRATQVGITRAQAEALTFVQDSYEKEVSDAYEAGFKSQLFHKRLSLNGAVFHTDVKNAQQFIFFPAGSVQAVTGIDEVKIDGFEFDANLRVGQALTLFGGYGNVDPRIKKYLAQPTAVGNRAPYISRYNISAGFQVNAPISTKINLLARGEYERQGSSWFDAVNTPGTARNPYNLVNARLGLSTDRWEVAAFARNLFDERYRIESVVLVTGLGVFNPGFKGTAQTFGVDAKVRF